LSNKVWIEPQIDVQLTGKISFKLDFNSSLLSDYGGKICYIIENSMHFFNHKTNDMSVIKTSHKFFT